MQSIGCKYRYTFQFPKFIYKFFSEIKRKAGFTKKVVLKAPHPCRNKPYRCFRITNFQEL